MTKKTIVIIASLAALAIIGAFLPEDKNATKPDATDSLLAEWHKPIEPVKDPNWYYDTSIDEMTSRPIYEAYTPGISITLNQSNNGNQGYTVKTYTTYNGQRGKRATTWLPTSVTHVKAKTVYADIRLNIRRMNEKNEVYLATTDGKIAMDDKYIRVRFDSLQPVSYKMTEGSDGPTTVFLSPASQFITSLKKAKKIIIEVRYQNEGSYLLHYDVDSLQWNYK